MPRARTPACRLAALPLLFLMPIIPTVAQPTPADQPLAPELTRLLTSDLHYERLSGFQRLAQMRAAPASSLALIAQGLGDADEAVRLTAAVALSAVTESPTAAARVAASALADTSPLVRQYAARAASCLGDPSGTAAQMLTAAASDPDPAVRGLATEGLKRLQGVGPGLQGARAGIAGGAAQTGGAASRPGRTGVGGASPQGRTGAGGASPQGRDAPSAEDTQPDMASVPGLIAALGHPDAGVRLRAAQALGEMGSRAVPALPALQRALAEPDAQVRQKVEWAIAQIWKPARAASDQAASAPPQGRIFFLADVVLGCDENGPELQDDLSCTSPGNFADLFQFASLSYLDLDVLARYRADAGRRGLRSKAPLNELCSEDPDWETVAPKFVFYKAYLKDHVIAITCNGQTRFKHMRFDSAGVMHGWGGGAHYGLTNGPQKVQVQVFTCEGFRLKFEFEINFEREGNIPAHLAAYHGPGDIGVPTRQLIVELEEEDKPISGLIADLSNPKPEKRSWAAQKLGRYGVQAASARSALEDLKNDPNRGVAMSAESAITYIDAKSPPDPGLAEYRKERAGRWASLAGVLWDAARDLAQYAERSCDDVMPYVQDAVLALRNAHSLYPPGAANNATISGIGYAMGFLNDGRLWPMGLEAMALYEDGLREFPISSADFWGRQRWCGWAQAWHYLAAAAISYRNDVPRFWAFEDRWASQAGALKDPSGRALEFPESRDHDAWPQPGWWRSEWNDVLPPEPENPEEQPEEAPEEVVVADTSMRDDLLSDLMATLEEVSASRSLEERWIGDLWDAMVTAERKRAEAIQLLRAHALMAQHIQERITALQGYLAKPQEPESANYWEAAFRLILDTWNDGWGPRPRLEDMGRAAISEQIRRLTAQHADILREQDRLINEVLGTYYDGVLQEIEAKKPGASWEQTRKCAERAYADARRARALAKAQLYSASGKGAEFREAAREALAAGVDEAQVRYLEAVYFHMKGDLRHALHGYRKVMELTSPQGAADEALTGAQARRMAGVQITDRQPLAEQRSALGDRARGMAWMLEHAYLDRIDAKAEGEAASLRTQLDDKLAKGGDEGWLSTVIATVKMGVVSSVGAIVMREDGAGIVGKENALETLASSFQNDVAKTHCGILLLKSLHERGVRIDHLDALTNDEFMGLMRQLYPTGAAKVDADAALHMRAAIKAAYNNPDVKRLLTVPKQMLDVDTGTPYFDDSDYQETALEWWGDSINAWNVATMLAPMSTYTVGGKVAWFPRWGWVGEAAPAAETIVSAKEAFSAAIGLNKLPQLLAQTPAGQKVLEQFAQFFAKSTWLEDRALDMSIQLAAGKVGEAAGGTIGVLRGTDGKTEAEAGAMLAQLFTAWGAGDVDVMKKCMDVHGITPDHLRALIKACEDTSSAASEAAQLGAGHSQALRQILDSVPENGALPAEVRQALETGSVQIKRMLDEIGERFQKGEASAAWRKLEELQIARQAYAAAEAGAIPEAKAWQDLLDKRVADWANRTKQMADQAAALSKSSSTLKPGATPAAAQQPIQVGFRSKDRIAGDLKRLVRQGEWEDAIAGYNQRLAVMRQLGAGDSEPVKRMAAEVQRVKTIAAARARYPTGAVVPEGPQDAAAAAHMKNIFSPEGAPDELADKARNGISALDADNNRLLERQAKIGESPSYSDPYWVKYGTPQKAETVAVFKGSGEGFADHYDLRAEQVYMTIGRECGLDVPDCALGKMTVLDLDTGALIQKEGILVRYVKGTKLEDLPPEVAIAFKQQIARDKVIAALLGDHDRHLGNYIIAADGRVWSIDHGMAKFSGDLVETDLLATPEQFEAAMRNRVMHWRARQGTKALAVRTLDDCLTLEDMAPTIAKVEALCKDEAKLRRLLSKHLSGDELENAMRVIPERAKVLRTVMRECFGTADDPLSAPPPALWVSIGEGDLPAFRALAPAA